MTVGPSSGTTRTVAHWDSLLEALAAAPRRRILVSLADASAGRRLPLPDVAIPRGQSVDREQFRLELKHRHLPLLAACDYVRWTGDPFCVRRGPRFAEPKAVVDVFRTDADRLPTSLAGGCLGADSAPRRSDG